MTIWPFGFVVEIRPRTTTVINFKPRALGSRLMGLKLLTPRPRGLYVCSLQVEFDELVDLPFSCREIPVGSFPYDPGDGSPELPPFVLHWLPTRVIAAGGPGVTLKVVSDNPTTHYLLTRPIWEEP